MDNIKTATVIAADDVASAPKVKETNSGGVQVYSISIKLPELKPMRC